MEIAYGLAIVTRLKVWLILLNVDHISTIYKKAGCQFTDFRSCEAILANDLSRLTNAHE